jgi:hypothetical protein
MKELFDIAGLSIAGQSLLDDEEHGDGILHLAARKFMDAPTDKLLTDTTLLDYLGMICLSAKFADSVHECWFVAVLLTKGIKSVDVMPRVVVEEQDGRIKAFYKHGMDVPAKILTALACFPEALEARTRRHGAPAPDFYRKLSKAELRLQRQPIVAEHHERWEDHLSGLL